MARTESRTKTAIWSDDDFRKLTARAQRMYWLLYTQPTISLCGSQALTVRRWAATAADETPETVIDALTELEDCGFVLVDGDTEEVLVRTFARHDGVGNSAKVLAGAWRQLAGIVSDRLRAAAENALRELGEPPDDLRRNTPSIPSTPVDNLQVDTLPDTVSDTPSDALSDTPSIPTAGARAPSPVSSLQSPSPDYSPQSPGAATPQTGTGATHGTKNNTHDLGALALEMAAVCLPDKPHVARQEACDVVAWAAPVVNIQLIEEAIGWARAKDDRPKLPRAVAAVILGKARDAGIPMHPFQPKRTTSARERGPA